MDNEKQRHSYSEIINEINLNIPDEKLRHLIFDYQDNYPGFLGDAKMYIQYFSNLLVLSSLVVYNAFSEWKQQNIGIIEPGKFSNSMNRLYNILNRTYDPLRIDAEYAENLLMNLSIDTLLERDNDMSFLEYIGIADWFNFSNGNNKLSEYIYVLKQQRMSSRYDASKRFSFNEFCDVMRIFSYVSKAKVDFVKNPLFNDHYNIIVSLYGKKLNMDYSVLVEKINRRSDILILKSVSIKDPKTFDDDSQKNQAVILEYSTFDMTASYNYLLSNVPMNCDTRLYENVAIGDTLVEDFIIANDIFCSNIYRVDSSFFENYIFLNNRFIKELSLTLSDSIADKTKAKIMQKFEKKYEEIFKQLSVPSLYSVGKTAHYRWDEIILFLMLERGVYDFISFLLKHESYKRFIRAFKMRFGKNTVQKILNENILIENPNLRLQHIESSNVNLNDCRTRALIELATVLLTENELKSDKCYSPTTIDDVLTEMERISKMDDETYKYTYCINVLSHIILFIKRFYYGVIEYTRLKKMYELSKGGIINQNEYNSKQKKWFEETQRKLDSLKEDYYDESMCETTVYTYSQKLESAFFALENFVLELNSPQNQDLKEVYVEATGKRQFYDSQIFNELKESLIAISKKSISHENNQKLYLFAQELLLFFKTGKRQGQSYCIEDAIFPIAANYNNGVDSRDGYKSAYFKVLQSFLEDDTHLRVISNDNFEFNCAYYCVPNVNRVVVRNVNAENEHVWLNPVIIPCSFFETKINKDIFVLQEVADYESTAELIYTSDEKLYSMLFGSLKTAKQVLCKLFDDSSSRFCKKHYRIIKKDHEVIAVAAVYDASRKELTKWDADAFTKHFRDIGEPLPKHYSIALERLRATFEDYLADGYYYIDDVCIKKENRRKGYGKSLLVSLIREVESDPMFKGIFLSVYKNNMAAINLYESLGFLKSQETCDESGVVTTKMVRL